MQIFHQTNSLTVGFNMLLRFRNSQKRVLSLLNFVNLKVFVKTLKLTQKKRKPLNCD